MFHDAAVKLKKIPETIPITKTSRFIFLLQHLRMKGIFINILGSSISMYYQIIN